MSFWQRLHTSTDVHFRDDAVDTLHEFVETLDRNAPGIRSAVGWDERWEDYVLLTAAETAVAPACVIHRSGEQPWPEQGSRLDVTVGHTEFAIGKVICTYWECAWPSDELSLEHVIGVSGDILKLRALGIDGVDEVCGKNLDVVVEQFSGRFERIADLLERPRVSSVPIAISVATWFCKSALLQGREADDATKELDDFLKRHGAWRDPLPA
jgi:hypothetical protein